MQKVKRDGLCWPSHGCDTRVPKTEMERRKYSPDCHISPIHITISEPPPPGKKKED